MTKQGLTEDVVCTGLDPEPINSLRRAQKQLPADQRKYFKRRRRLLLAHMGNLSTENEAAVERLLLISPNLGDAHLLKEKFYEFTAFKNAQQARERLRAFRTFAFVADIPEFQPCLTMLQNWQPYISMLLIVVIPMRLLRR